MKKGTAVSFGYAVGKVLVKESQEIVLDQHQISDVEAEKNKLQTAISVSVSQLEKLKEKTEKEMGEDKAQIFAAHIMLAEDPVYVSEVEELIDNKLNAEMAVSKTTAKYLEFFSSMEDEYMVARKYSSSCFTSLYSSSQLSLFHIPSVCRHCEFRQNLQRSGHP